MSRIDQNQLITDDEDFEGSGATADYGSYENFDLLFNVLKLFWRIIF